MKHVITIAILLFSLNSLAADESAKFDRAYGFVLPSGAWLLTVEFPLVPGAPPPPPAFKETLTLHPLGTASESNTLLNENSYNPALGMGCGFTGPGGSLELNCNGSEGTGSWRRTGRKTISFVIVKFIYDGVTNAHVGYLRVSSDRAIINGNELIQKRDFTLTEFLVGTDIDTAIAIPLGGADSVGYRIQ